ncbi:MAG: GTPase ObgE [Candidatus Marinimicrobia bacterium]|nr:GTPase ObgE [Candidatus Neomarinimicrobiota bacterium]
MLIDDVTIQVKAGDGGDGAVAFNKIKMAKGPTGADGGNGGNVYMEGVSEIDMLAQFRYRKKLGAKKGVSGGNHSNDGANGEDLILKVPVGTVIHNLTTKEDKEITKVGQRVLVAEGGQGGRGNFYFRSSRNTTPMEYEEGTEGEEFDLRLELKLIADVGFVGLPNVGKSSLLNELTNAESKVANYSFTTLDPNLGVYYGLVLADIPGLIEGASEGKGLGVKFLQHIERTRVIFHFISSESSDPLKDYETIRKELGDYDKKLLEKEEHVFLSKTDLFDEKEIKEKIKILKTKNKKVTPVSVIDDESLREVGKILREIIKQKNIKK